MPYTDLRRGRYSAPAHAYLVTTVTADRRPFFTDPAIGRIVVREMRALHDACEIESMAWVLMPDHLHWLFVLGEKHSLQDVMGHFKGRSSRQVNRALRRHGAVWQKSFHDRAIRAEWVCLAAARYIVANPLRAGLVRRVGDYPLWDAQWL